MLGRELRLADPSHTKTTRRRNNFDDHHTPNAIMSDNNDEVEVENPVSSWPVLPKEVTAELGSIKLFNKWSYEDVEVSLNKTAPRSSTNQHQVRDISLTDYIQIRSPGTSLSPSTMAQANANPSLHLTLRRSICRKAIPKSAMPHH